MKILTGAVVRPNCPLADIQALRSLGCRLVRYQIYAEKFGWHASVMNQLDNLDMLLAQDTGMLFIVDIHAPPSGQAELVAMWKLIATAYRDNDDIRAYGILNEPAQNCRTLMERAVKEIRTRDITKTVCVTCKTGQVADNFTLDNNIASGLPRFSPIQSTRLWYEAHMYRPMEFTHQGLPPAPGLPPRPVGVACPSWAELEKYLAPVIKIGKTGKQILIGEFGVSAFAEPQERLLYLRRCVALFRQYDFNWCYHAFGDAPVWQPSPDMLEVLAAEWYRS